MKNMKLAESKAFSKSIHYLEDFDDYEAGVYSIDMCSGKILTRLNEDTPDEFLDALKACKYNSTFKEF